MSGQDADQRHAHAGIEADVDAVLAEFGGDARHAIAALLHDFAVLAADSRANVSRGFTRGRISPFRRGARVRQK